ncbi:MAG: hypothetical protein QME07_05820 [bacterium]|nr:hypothetical protein [bacterium]
MNKEEIRLFRERYKKVEEIERKELQNTPYATKFLQLIETIHLRERLGLSLSIKSKKEGEARNQWIKLKNNLNH